MTSIGVLAESTRAFWERRSRRERIAVGFGIAILAGLLTYGVLVAPAIRGRLELDRALPLLRQQAAELEALARQAGPVAQAGGAVPRAANKQGIEESLSQKGLKAQSVVVDGGTTRVQLTAISFASLLDWLGDAQKAGWLAVVEANIVALPAPDSVNATLTLRQTRGEGLQ